MTAAAGIECYVDPLLFNTIKTHHGKIERIESRQHSLSVSLSSFISLFPLFISLSLPPSLSLPSSLPLTLSFFLFLNLSHSCPPLPPLSLPSVDKTIDDKQVWFPFLAFVGMYLP